MAGRMEGEAMMTDLMSRQLDALNRRREQSLELVAQQTAMQIANEARIGQMQLAAKQQAEASIREMNAKIEAAESGLLDRAWNAAQKHIQTGDVTQAAKNLDIIKKRTAQIVEQGGVPPRFGAGQPLPSETDVRDFVLGRFGAGPQAPAMPAAPALQAAPNMPTAPTTPDIANDPRALLALGFFGGPGAVQGLAQMQENQLRAGMMRQQMTRTREVGDLIRGGADMTSPGVQAGIFELTGQLPDPMAGLNLRGQVSSAQQQAAGQALSTAGIVMSDPTTGQAIFPSFDDLDADEVVERVSRLRGQIDTAIADFKSRTGADDATARRVLAPFIQRILIEAQDAAESETFELTDRPRAIRRIQQIREALGLPEVRGR